MDEQVGGRAYVSSVSPPGPCSMQVGHFFTSRVLPPLKKNIFMYICMAALGLRCCSGTLWLRQVGATLHCSAWASHHSPLGLAGFGSYSMPVQ